MMPHIKRKLTESDKKKSTQELCIDCILPPKLSEESTHQVLSFFGKVKCFRTIVEYTSEESAKQALLLCGKYSGIKKSAV